MKTALKVFGGLAVLFLMAIIVIPLVVDVDKYRPEIVKAANEQLNGKLTLGKLRLNLWGRIRVSVDGLKLDDAQGKAIATVKDASFDLPYTSILSGSPLMTVSMKSPEIFVSKNKAGVLNVMTLMKTIAASATTDASSASAGTANNTVANSANGQPSKSGAIALPAMALNARVGVYIEHAKLVYNDEAMQLTNTVDDFNLRVKDFSLSRATELELWANLKTQMGKDMKVEGPLRLEASLKPDFSMGTFKSAAVVARFDADDLEIHKGDLFYKKKGIAANFRFDGILDQSQLEIHDATARFHNAAIVVNGVFHKEKGAQLSYKAESISLSAWNEIVPMLKEFDLSGEVSMKGQIKGQVAALDYTADIGVKDFSMKGPGLKSKPVIQGAIQIATDRVEKFKFDVKGPGNDISLSGKVTSFSKPQIQFSLTSDKGMDLDQWIDFPEKSASKKDDAPTSDAKAGKQAATASGSSEPDTASSGAKTEDADAMLDALRKNEVARAMGIEGSVRISMLKMMNVKMQPIHANVQMKNLVLAIQNINMGIFAGSVKGSFSTNMVPARPEYSIKVAVTSMDIAKAVESQFESFKNTLLGTLSASVEGGGVSFNPAIAKKRLQMKGNFNVQDATFKTIDIAKAVNEALGSTLDKLGDKVPAAKGKKVQLPSKGESKYEKMSGTFTIKDGLLDAPDFVAKAAPKGGVDLKGLTRMGLVDESLDARWEVTDTQRMTGADQVNVDIAGKQIKNILAKNENDPVTLPIKVGCKWSAPCANYSEVPEYLIGIAMGRVAKGAGEAAKSKAMEAAQDVIKKNLGNGGGISDGLKKLFGR